VTGYQSRLPAMMHVMWSGDTLHYRFISDYTGVDWGFKFTVTGCRVGQFDIGSQLLETLLTCPSAMRSARSLAIAITATVITGRPT